MALALTDAGWLASWRRRMATGTDTGLPEPELGTSAHSHTSCIGRALLFAQDRRWTGSTVIFDILLVDFNTPDQQLYLLYILPTVFKPDQAFGYIVESRLMKWRWYWATGLVLFSATISQSSFSPARSAACFRRR